MSTEATDILVPCARVDFKTGQANLGERQALRNDAVVDYLAAKLYALDAHDAFVLVMGGFSAINGEVRNRPGESEDDVAIDDLVRRGVPEDRIRQIGGIGTFYGGVGAAIKKHKLEPNDYTQERKLLVALPDKAYQRYRLILGAMNLNLDAVHNLPVRENERSIREAVGLRMTRRAMKGVTTYEDLLRLDEKRPPAIVRALGRIKS